jgi:tRNA-modifying protein YgfZ
MITPSTYKPESFVAMLDGLALVRARGRDTVKFLQSQLTNDIEQVTDSHSLMAAWCDPKGRSLALFQVCKHGDDLCLIAPAQVVHKVLPKLKMYVMRAKVSLEIDPTISATGLYGPRASEWLATLTASVPLTGEATSIAQNCQLVGLTGASRWLLIGANEDVQALTRDAIANGCVRAEQSLWRLGAIQAGQPEIYAQTSGEFVPQMLNLELLDGVSFSKGCYPGQEIVARTQYLGRIKRRTVALQAQTIDATPAPGDVIVDMRTAARLGQVVDAVADASGTLHILAVLRVDALADAELSFEQAGSALFQVDLPYSLESATAPPA